VPVAGAPVVEIDNPDRGKHDEHVSLVRCERRQMRVQRLW